MRGTVLSADDGQSMAEVEVTLTNEATGGVKVTATNADGSYAFTNVQIGGPYNVTAAVVGFKSAEEKGIFLTANRTRDVTLKLHLQEEVIEVSSAPVARNTSNRTVVTAAEIESLPSVSRDPRDVVRRNPEVSVEGSSHTLSIGGANNRFNSVTVDGVRQDDDFGLNASGYPTRRSPIALSAIQELTVDTSPFDVHYAKFLGGNVNIVTKSGTNEFKGTVFGSYSSDSLLGNRSGNKRISIDFRDLRYGATVGGPIIKDQLYFLASVEGLNSTSPIDNGPLGSGAANITTQVMDTDVARAQQIARNVYGFDPGVTSKSGKEGDLKLFFKLDWNIDKQNRATASYQRTAGNQIQVGNSATANSLPLSSNWYDARDTLNTLSLRVFSDWTDQLSTEVGGSVKLVTSRVPPLNGDDFMAATINIGTRDMPGGQGAIRLGPDASRHANSLDNDVYHTKAEANYLLAQNLFTAGIEYEYTKINNLFVQNANGSATYASLDDFEAKKPTQIVFQNSITLNPEDAAANWHYGLWSGYLQDQIKLTPELTLTGGLRYDIYQTSSRSTRNQNFVNKYGFENNASLNGRDILQPRLGISWLPFNNLNIRAGAGLYSGGTPAVWMSNNYTNDGVRTFSFTDTKAADVTGFDGRTIPQALRDAVANGKGNGNVDSLDPNFKIPSVWKVGVGADYSLDIPNAGENGRNIEVKGNYTFTKVNHSVTWSDLRRNLDDPSLPNNTPIGETVDGRPFYAANFNTRRGFDMMLTNDDRGYGHVASIVLQKGFAWGLFVSGSYAYTDNQEVNPGTSSVSTSNYGITAVTNPEHPGLAVSNYERRHRFTGTLEYSHAIVGEFTDAEPWKNMKTSFGMFAESRSGQPYSWTFGGGDTTGANLSAIFGEEQTLASRNRELFYVPTDARTCEAPGPNCDVVLKGFTKAQFNTFLDRSGLAGNRGQVVKRNSSTGPRFNRVDVRLAQDLPNPINGHRARFLIDIENVGNLLNHNWGVSRQVPFPYFTPAADVQLDRATGTYTYSGLRSPNPTTIDVLQSVWRLSLGLSYDF